MRELGVAIMKSLKEILVVFFNILFQK